MDIWRVVERPYDSVKPDKGPVTNPTVLAVNVIDAEVISVDLIDAREFYAPQRHSPLPRFVRRICFENSN